MHAILRTSETSVCTYVYSREYGKKRNNTEFVSYGLMKLGSRRKRNFLSATITIREDKVKNKAK